MQATPQIKQFSGFLNTDDSNETLLSSDHKFAINGRFRGASNNLRFENVEGNTLVHNPYLPAGKNECIGAYFDEINKRIISFNYNSLGNHAIYQHSLITGLWLRIIQVGYNTTGDILAFDLDNPIYAVKMLYGDAVQGDTIYWNNCQKEPCQVNIERALAGGYGSIKRSYIDVIKAPSIMPPAVTYENDSTVTVNNFRRQLLVYKTRFVYSNLDKSVWSSISELPLPINYMDTAIDKDPTKNCRVAIVVQTGDIDVAKIEVAAALSQGNTYGDFFEIAVLDKTVLSIASNNLYTFRFYNNQAYFPIDIEESIQQFDLVPLKALALEILNGNVPIYGAITEGYDKTVVTGTSTSGSETQQTTQYPYIFLANQSGDSGFGTGDIHIVCIGSITPGDQFFVVTSNFTLGYSGLVGSTADVINGLAAIAVSDGFTVVSSDTENLVINKSGESLLRTNSVPLFLPVTDSFVYDRNSRYNYVLVYFDAAGRTIGSLTSDGMNYQTINYTESTFIPNIPKIGFSISSRPPLYAAYYQIGRTKNLTKLKKIEWVSDRTYKDADFAYISIESLNVFIAQNPSSKFLAWDVSSSDRIRFYKVLSGSVNTVYTNQDFQIQSQVFNPTINGTIHAGQFIKIALPTTSGTFNFGTVDFFNYFIELYTPAQSVANGLDFDYEFGVRYAIGNPGTATAFHQGQLQNQTSNLSQPATFEFTKGDYYYRNRVINAGDTILYSLGAQTLSPSNRLAQSLVNQTLPSTNYAVAETVTQGTFVNNYSSPGWTINVNTGTYVWTVKGTINLRAVTTTVQNFRIQLYVVYGTTSVLYPLGNQTGATAGDNITFTVSTSITMPPNSKCFLVMNCSDSAFRLDVVSGDITYSDASKTFTIGVVDPNFSDFFQSAVNSNGRPWIVDSNAAQVFNPTLMRWGLAYQPNTNINQTNRFKPLNFNEIDRSKGKIQVYKVRENILRIIQERGCGKMGIYAKYLQDTNGKQVVTTTDDIITKNNIDYYEGVFGVGNQPTGFVSGKNQDYFIDPVRGYQLRLSNDGLSPISEIYKGQFFIQPLFIPYNDPYQRATGGYSKILGYYNYAEEECVMSLQSGTYNGKSIENYTFSFNEKRNSYCSFFDFNPEWIISAEDITYSWKNGQMWVHNNKIDYTSFYGTKYNPSILIVFNDKVGLKKTPLAIGYQSNVLWTAPENGDILTSQPNSQTGMPQISKLKDFNFSIIEGEYIASLQRDINSRANPLDAWYNGDYLKGVWMQIKLTYHGNDFAYLYLPYMKYEVSNPNF